MSQHIRGQRLGAVLLLTLARPEKKNALTSAMYGALADAIVAAETDTTVRVLLIRAEGDTFTAGNDLGDFATIAAADETVPRHVGRFLHALADATKPIVAAVQGKAVGVGTTMLLHCDFVLLGAGAELSTPFVNLALTPEAASSLLLPATIGHQRAFAMLALGESVGATDAVAWGLANRVVVPEMLDREAFDVAERLARQPSDSLRATKRLMRDETALHRKMDVEATAFEARVRSPEAREAFAAFAEKRSPDFTPFG